jgi:phytoene/squalene synthetase
MKELFDDISIRCSRLTTKAYSTSFSIGIRCLKKELRDPVYAIYGFVRFADEIVDTFHNYDKEKLLWLFEESTHQATQDRISLNPILNSFQHTVHRYQIERELIDRFLYSMKLDLKNKAYDTPGLEEYIFGSAEVVGLMCLRVFVDGDRALFEKLKPFAMRLGAAFQKINFLRDLNADFTILGRSYFPGVDLDHFDETSKRQIEASISADLHVGYLGIKQLPRSARFGVYVAYAYYLALFKKIKNTSSEHMLKSRIRIRNRYKATLLAYSYVKHQLNML